LKNIDKNEKDIFEDRRMSGENQTVCKNCIEKMQIKKDENSDI
jgi:hypothetical protein